MPDGGAHEPSPARRVLGRNCSIPERLGRRLSTLLHPITAVLDRLDHRMGSEEYRNGPVLVASRRWKVDQLV